MSHTGLFLLILFGCSNFVPFCVFLYSFFIRLWALNVWDFFVHTFVGIGCIGIWWFLLFQEIPCHGWGHGRNWDVLPLARDCGKWFWPSRLACQLNAKMRKIWIINENKLIMTLVTAVGLAA